MRLRLFMALLVVAALLLAGYGVLRRATYALTA